MLPLSTPIRTLKGDAVGRLQIAKGASATSLLSLTLFSSALTRTGTAITIVMAAVNRAPSLWGTDAGVFRPERWLEEKVGDLRAKEVQGHRHLLTFSDGTRMCVARARRLKRGIRAWLTVCGFFRAGVWASSSRSRSSRCVYGCACAAGGG